MNFEVQKMQETGPSKLEAIQNLAQNLDGKAIGDTLQTKYEDFQKGKQEQNEAKNKKEFTEFLKNFKYTNLIKNTVIQEALKFPEDTEQVKKIQLELGYKPGSKNYYPEEHRKDMKNGPDGKAGPYIIDALNNMIAEGLTSDETQQLSQDFDNKADKEKSEQASKILDAYVKLRGY